MLTKIGNQILDEFKSELDSELNSQNFILSEGRSFLRSILYLVDRFFFSLALAIPLLLFVGICSLNAETFMQIKTMDIKQWLQVRELLIFVVLSVTALGMCLWIALNRKSRHQSAKEQVAEQNENDMALTKRQIELIEEVLFRHNLITRKGS